MKLSIPGRDAFGIGLALLTLAGCGGFQSGKPGAGPLALPALGHAAYGRSWMKPGASGGDLLYVSVGTEVYVFSYPQGTRIQTLTGFSGYTRGECSDTQGNVFIFDPSAHDLVEYAHGGSSPINTLSLSSGGTCAIDPATNDLAVPEGNTVAIFTNEQGTPKVYKDPSFSGFHFCGYDDNGNLFLQGETSGGSVSLVEFNSGSGSFNDITLNEQGGYGDIQWDGRYLAIDNSSGRPLSSIYRVQVSGSIGKVVATIRLKDAQHLGGDMWIGGGNLVLPIGQKEIGFWSYPGGGAPIKVMPRIDFPHPIGGMTVSVAPSK